MIVVVVAIVWHSFDPLIAISVADCSEWATGTVHVGNLACWSDDADDVADEVLAVEADEAGGGGG